MKKSHVAGLILWRGGLLLVGGTLAYWALRGILTITDPRLELAVAILLTGVLFVFLSVVIEQVADSRNERSDAR